ncbi:zinc-dependent peptidase [Ectothiorhodospiraceae bacterium 2226]|nr:zinc-dependent peptidase [Ectothiorhodospiraceae bacterium 2226]
MWWTWKAWWRRRVLKRGLVPVASWRAAVAELPLLARYTPSEQHRLRELATLFLHEKVIVGAGDLQLEEAMQVRIAALACLPVLNLDLDYLRGWVEIIVYPGQFTPEHEYTDEAGVVHVTHHPLAGEAWLQGPLVLSWEDILASGRGDGFNVVIHELAHKLDMLDGEANGFPPLHEGMAGEAWTQAFAEAFADMRRRDEGGEDTVLDPYAAEDPAEFFAVMSEAFFETPHLLAQTYPAVYEQLRVFYRQDPDAGGTISHEDEYRHAVRHGARG